MSDRYKLNNLNIDVICSVIPFSFAFYMKRMEAKPKFGYVDIATANLYGKFCSENAKLDPHTQRGVSCAN